MIEEHEPWDCVALQRGRSDTSKESQRSLPEGGQRMTKKKKRPGGGDFARGERTKATPDEGPDFARGERTTND